MNLSLTGKVAIITGGGSGIGRTIAETYAAAGAKVVISGRRTDKLAEVVAAISAAGGTARGIAVDITSEDSVTRLFSESASQFGGVDILVNNAGSFGGGPTDEVALTDWRAMIEVNLTGAFLCSREAFRTMKAKRSGRIINIGSTSAKVPRAGSAAYAASKFGLQGLTHAMAVEAREFGIGVSIIHPGNTVPGVWSGQEDKVRAEGLMDASSVAQIALVMAGLPPDVLLYESVVLPLGMPFLGRG